jgi:hypothetical protein
MDLHGQAASEWNSFPADLDSEMNKSFRQIQKRNPEGFRQQLIPCSDDIS